MLTKIQNTDIMPCISNPSEIQFGKLGLNEWKKHTKKILLKAN